MPTTTSAVDVGAIMFATRDETQSGTPSSVRTNANFAPSRSKDAICEAEDDVLCSQYIFDLVKGIQVPLATIQSCSSKDSQQVLEDVATVPLSQSHIYGSVDRSQHLDFSIFESLIVGVANVPNTSLPTLPGDTPCNDSLPTDTATFAKQLARTRKHLKPSRRTTAPLDVFLSAQSFSPDTSAAQISDSTGQGEISIGSTKALQKNSNSVSIAELAARFDNAAIQAGLEQTPVSEPQSSNIVDDVAQTLSADESEAEASPHSELSQLVHAHEAAFTVSPTPDHVSQPLSTDLDAYEIPVVKTVSRGQPMVHYVVNSGGLTPIRRPRTRTYHYGQQASSQVAHVSRSSEDVLPSLAFPTRLRPASPVIRLANGLPAPEEYSKYAVNPYRASTLADDDESIQFKGLGISMEVSKPVSIEDDASVYSNDIGPDHSALNQNETGEFSAGHYHSHRDVAAETFASPQPDRTHCWERSLRGLVGDERSSDEISRISNEYVQDLANVMDPDGSLRRQERRKRKKSYRSRLFTGAMPEITSNSFVTIETSSGDGMSSSLQTISHAGIASSLNTSLPRSAEYGNHLHAADDLCAQSETFLRSSANKSGQYTRTGNQREESEEKSGVGLGLRINTRVDVRGTQLEYFIEAGMSPECEGLASADTGSPQGPSKSPSPVKSGSYLSKITSNTSSRGHKSSISGEAASMKFGFDKLPFNFSTPSRRGTANTDEIPVTPSVKPFTSTTNEPPEPAKKENRLEKYFRDLLSSSSSFKAKEDVTDRDRFANGKLRSQKKSRKNSDTIEVISSPVPSLSENCSLVTAARARGITDPLSSFRRRADSRGIDKSGPSLTSTSRAGPEQTFTASLEILQEQEVLIDYSRGLDQLGEVFVSVSRRSHIMCSIRRYINICIY